tara:strand:+ start:7243 stop:7692 length:450 start_codon:yes stop_codon:yes gene_type:complete
MHIETDTAEEAKPLNMRQQKFVDYYSTSGNATRSAEAAGYRHPNVQAFRLLENISVKASIEAIRDDMAKDTEDRRAKWVSRLEDLGVSAEKDSDRLRAIEQLFKAEGWVAPEKQEIVQFNGAFLADLDLDDEEVGEIQGEIPFENNDMH